MSDTKSDVPRPSRAFQGFRPERRQQLVECFAGPARDRAAAEALVTDLEDELRVFLSLVKDPTRERELREALRTTIAILRKPGRILTSWPDIPDTTRRAFAYLAELLMLAWLPARPGGRPKGTPADRNIVEHEFLDALERHAVKPGSYRAARAFAIVLNDTCSAGRRLDETAQSESAKRALAKAAERQRKRRPAVEEHVRRSMEALKRAGWFGPDEELP